MPSMHKRYRCEKMIPPIRKNQEIAYFIASLEQIITMTS